MRGLVTVGRRWSRICLGGYDRVDGVVIRKNFMSHNRSCILSRCFLSTASTKNTNTIRTLSKAAKSGFSYPGPRRLKDIVKLPLLEKKNREEVEEIWKKYHQEQKSSVADVLSDVQYEMLKQRSQRCPFFVLPVYRKSGYFTLILQWQDKYCMLTFLEDYRKNPTSAEPYVTFTVYDDFIASKQIALVCGDVTNKLSYNEGEGLWCLIKKFYLEEIKDFDLVVRFNEKSREFNFNEVLRRVQQKWTTMMTINSE